MKKTTNPQLVAHRGYSKQYPENTLLAIEQAFRAGACFVECDVQLTKDHIPVLLHDADLLRTSGLDGNVHELDWADIAGSYAGYQKRFADQFSHVTISQLAEFAELLRCWPARKAFVEIKRSSIRKFGHNQVIVPILDALKSVNRQVILISFDLTLMQMIKESAGWQFGLVLERWDNEILQQATLLQPEFVFIDYEKLPEHLESLPEASWRWVVYEIDDPQLALDWLSRGASLIETNDIGTMIEWPAFSPGVCDDGAEL